MTTTRELCKELYDSRRWTKTRSGWSGTRKFVVQNNSTAIALLPPIGSRWAIAGGQTELVCVKHEFEPYGTTTASLYQSPTHWMVTVEYQSTSWSTDPIVTFETDLEVLDNGRYRTYKSDGAYRLEYAGTTYPLIGLSVEIQKRIADLHQTMELLGKINSAPVTVLGRYTWGAKKLLFAGFNTRIEYDETGTKQYHCYYKFQYRPNVPSWNHVWRTEPGENFGGWDELDPPLYQVADFSPLSDILNGGE